MPADPTESEIVRLTEELRQLAAEQDRQRADLAATRAALVIKVAELRAAGATWRHIGDALGVGATAAHKRFGRDTHHA